jgi:hypothetical protein
MLAAEVNGQPFVKSRHRAHLIERIGRSAGSVEFKHRNISAVLEELGMRRIRGYVPALNYQGAIVEAIGRYLTHHTEEFSEVAEPTVPWIDPRSLFVEVPAIKDTKRTLPELDRLVRKFDPAERDERNRALGRAGEEFVLRVEREQLRLADRPDLAERVRWVADEEGDGAGFDVLSFDPAGSDRLIEVKTTNGAARTPFFLSRNERNTAERKQESWQLYRVHLFSENPQIFTLRPPLERSLLLRTETWRASFA